MDDTASRRVLCRLGFVLCCLVPTVAVCWWSWHARQERQLRQLHASWEQWILAETGLRGVAEHIQVGRRGDVLLSNLVLSDPETRAEVARIRQVHAAPAGERGWVLDVSYPVIPARQLARLWEPLYDRLRIARGSDSWSGLISARNVTLVQGEQNSSLSHWE